MDAVIAEQICVLDAFAGRTATVGADVFGARERLFAGAGAVVKVTMLASAIAKLSAEVVGLGGEAVTQATGIMLARFADAMAVERLRELLTVEGEGAVTVLRGFDGCGMLPRAGSAAALMREIKRRFDPKGTLNPGVVIG
jgi:hypothetical protein